MYLIKLVRDKIPKLLDGEREIGFVDLGPVEFDRMLKAKLMEECWEYATARTGQERLGELADIYELIDALAWRFDQASMGDVIRIAEQKRRDRGGFFTGVGMGIVDDRFT